MYIKKPGEELGWLAYFNPLSADSWRVTLAWMFFAGLFLALPTAVRRKYGKAESDHQYDFGYSLFVTMSSFFSQGSAKKPVRFLKD